MNDPRYSAVDWQLLFELRVALLQKRPLPMTTLRIMRERGWIAIPLPEQWIPVRAALADDVSQETIEAYSYVLATPILLEVGRREMNLFSRVYDDADLEGLYAEELEGEVDDADLEDEDGPDY